jgi:ribosomal protein S25
MQFKPIAVILVLFLVVASLSISGCLSSNTSNQAATNPPNASTATNATAQSKATPTVKETTVVKNVSVVNNVVENKVQNNVQNNVVVTPPRIATDISIRATSMRWVTIWVIPKNAPVTENEIVRSGSLTVTLNGQVVSAVDGGVASFTYGTTKNGTIMPGSYAITATYSGTNEYMPSTNSVTYYIGGH